MARPPHNHRRNQWVSFFFGSPRRFLFTVAGLFLAGAAIRPDLATRALQNALGSVIDGVSPYVGPIIGICIAIWAIYAVILAPFKSKKKKGDH